MTDFIDARRFPAPVAASQQGVLLLRIDHKQKTVEVAHNLPLSALPRTGGFPDFGDLLALATGEAVEAELTARLGGWFSRPADTDLDVALAVRDGYAIRVVRVWHEQLEQFPAEVGVA